MKQYSTRRLPVQRGPAAWGVLLGLHPEPNILDDDVTADFVIVGAGLAGLSAARRLTQIVPDAKVVVLEAGRLAEGAAGRNSGFMIDLPHNLPGAKRTEARGERQQIALNRQAQKFAGEAVQDYHIKPDYFERAGKISGAADIRTEAIIHREADHLTEIGEPFELLDAKSMYDITGSHYYYSGLYTPGTVMLQPAGYIRGLASGLVRDGVSIFENGAVSSFRREGSGWSVATTRGKVSAGKVILAVNGHLESFGLAKSRLMQMFFFGAMTSELRSDKIKMLSGHDRWGITSADPMGATVRRIDTGQGGNRIIIRAVAALRSGMESRA